MRFANLILSACVLFSGACATTLPRSSSDVESEARRTLGELVSAYQNNQVDEFFSYFSPNSFSGFESFRERVRDFLLRNHPVTIDPIIDTVLEEGPNAAVQFHWNRSFVDPAGSHRLDSGRCEIIFRKRPSGGVAVIAIRGDSPF